MISVASQKPWFLEALENKFSGHAKNKACGNFQFSWRQVKDLAVFRGCETSFRKHRNRRFQDFDSTNPKNLSNLQFSNAPIFRIC